MDLSQISQELSDAVSSLEFGAPVSHVYNPLTYAWESHQQYLQRYGSKSPRETLLFGMNPGPWGMAQTGVPFGHIELVRDWLGIHAPIVAPTDQHPKRPIQGFDCPRLEGSGARLWGWARDRFQTPEAFFSRFFIGNYCPLAFMEASGRNRTPDKLPAAERKALLPRCDHALRQVVLALQPTFVVGVGGFAEKRARIALKGIDVTIGRILHPSPANPQANRGWAAQAEDQLQALGIQLPPKSNPKDNPQ